MSPRAKEAKIEVLGEAFDHHHEQYRKDAIERMATEGGAHVYLDLDHMIVSSRPLSPRAVRQATYKDQIEQAREALKDGEAPSDVWGRLYVSGSDVARIARQEGITLPRHWFKQAWEEAHCEHDVCNECRKLVQ
jgi:hypothetical protein